ncbi:MAG TPA: GNAT family N-acetyltransferase, partial [Candidatus Lokiarchaeia archaeon]|nr:GNAT family N-acetyltransferase [Candidatus Lokiarchaeia archaeon]
SELKAALEENVSKACQVISKSRHRILVQIATSQKYPIKLLTTIFREYNAQMGRKVLFGIVAGAEPAVRSDGTRSAALELGLQLRNRLPNLKFQYAPFWEIQSVLGSTQDFSILDLTAQFNPDDVAIAVEAVAGPGVIVLITPLLDDWPGTQTKFLEQFNYAGEAPATSHFIARFISLLQASENVILIEEDHLRLYQPKWTQASNPEEDLSFTPAGGPKSIMDLTLTADQRQAFNGLTAWFATTFAGKRKKANCYLHAFRGRGKTALLGLAFAEIVARRAGGQERKAVRGGVAASKISLAITSPELAQVQVAFFHLQNALTLVGVRFQTKKTGDLISEVTCAGGTLFYSAPADVATRKRIDGVIVDEAGSIPVPLLEKIAYFGVPCIWSTTTHGYEGIGRGFALKFLPWLERIFGQVETLTMSDPIRYNVGDPIEQLFFRAFFLDADLPDQVPPAFISSSLSLVENPGGNELSEHTLDETFGLLVAAHYKTHPSDFVPILDIPSWQLWVEQPAEGNVIGAILAIPEGGLPEEKATQLASARKERQGLLASWVIALHHQSPDFVSRFLGVRIARIAVHPLLQGHGIGTHMLAELEAEEIARGLHFLATSFGATPELLHFWLKSGYVPIHLSLSRSKSTGEYSVVMVKSIHDVTKQPIAIFGADFKVKLVDWIRDVLFDLDPTVVAPLLSFQHANFSEILPRTALSASEMRRLDAYCQDVLKFKAACDVIRKVLLHYFYDMDQSRPVLDGKSLEILVAKLQSRSWTTIQAELRVPAQRAYGIVREAVKKIARHYHLFQAGTQNGGENSPSEE